MAGTRRRPPNDPGRAGGFARPAPGTRTSADDIDELLSLAGSDDPATRQLAVANLCTCHVRADDDRVWARLLDLFRADPDPKVRGGALHAITDSTPAARVPAVASALEAGYHEPHPPLRRRIRKTLAHYRRTGQMTDAPR